MRPTGVRRGPRHEQPKATRRRASVDLRAPLYLRAGWRILKTERLTPLTQPRGGRPHLWAMRHLALGRRRDPCRADRHRPANTARGQVLAGSARNGYTMEGMNRVPDSLLEHRHPISARQVLPGFASRGYRDGVPVWLLVLSGHADTRNLMDASSFDTRSLRFPTGGQSRSQQTYQGVRNGQRRGEPIAAPRAASASKRRQTGHRMVRASDNRWIEESSIDPFTPLRAFPMDVRLDCDPVVPVS